MCDKSDCCKKEEPLYEGESDDVWASDNDEPTNPTAELRRTHNKQGYLDGLSHAKEESLQTGFDDGFPKGASLGIMVGQILSTVRSHDPLLFDQCKQELNIAKVLNKKYFDDDLEMDTSQHLVLMKWKAICEEMNN